VPLHASRGQIYLPADVLARHRVDPQTILGGDTTPKLLNALNELRQKAREHYRELDRLLPSLPRAAQPAFLPLVLANAYLEQMDERRYDPFRTPIEISQFKRQWKLWRAARRAP
jgi:phytoene synthase